MNEASQWRFAFARKLAPIYAANSHVAAVIVSGSTARGHADRYSDIELGVFWHRPPSDADRQAAAEAIDQEWKGSAAVYPDGLRLAVVRQYAQIDHFWRSEMWLARSENLTMLYQSFVQAHQQMLHVLLGLNKVYYFGFKWLDVIAEYLEQKPPDLVRRLRRAYQVDPAEGAEEVSAIAEEVYGLIENELPEIDVAWLRSVFRYRRPKWDQAPPIRDGFAAK